MNTVDLYHLLFGKNHITDGDVISMAEHGRVGGASNAQGFKFVDTVCYTTRITYSGNSPIYIGEATPGSVTSAAVWRIKKLIYSGDNVSAILWADGNDEYDNIWDNRVGLDYS